MSKPPIDKKMFEAEEQIKRQLLYCIPLFILAIGIPFFAYYSLFIPVGEQADTWFQRSGSLTVLFAVWMEYNLMKINEDVNPSGRVVTQQVDLSNKYKDIYKITQFIVVSTAISGTVIWGYGNFFK